MLRHISFLLRSAGQASDPIHHFTILQSPVFLLNSRFSQFFMPCFQGAPYPEVTDLNLPSSFSIIHSHALVYSTYSPESVYGTVKKMKKLFS